MFQITVEKSFHASHALKLPDGSLEPVHAHDWPVVVTVGADSLDKMETVMDFHELERIVEHVIDPLRDLHLNDIDPYSHGMNPSAERVAEHIGHQIAADLPKRVKLVSVALGEEVGCTAIYRP